MRGRKNVAWRNSCGQEIVFNNIDLFVESIDMTGTAGIHTVESLAGADGQVTIGHNLGAKTIPCSFALKDKTGTRLENLAQMFRPEIGLLTVTTADEHVYRIDCYPQNIPTFKRDSGVPYVWRFDVDFIADKPLWRKGSEIEVLWSDLPLISGLHTIQSICVYDIPPKIHFPATNHAVTFNIQNGALKRFTLKKHEDFAVLVNTDDFSVTNASTGANVNNLLDPTAELDDIRIKYGNNAITFSSASQGTGVKIIYTELSAGEV